MDNLSNDIKQLEQVNNDLRAEAMVETIMNLPGDPYIENIFL